MATPSGGPRLAKIASVSRTFHCSTVDQSGGAWRVNTANDFALCILPSRHGFPINPSHYGPLTDLPDWSFADGRPAPPMKNHLRRKEKNENLARRIAMISAEMDQGVEKWKAKQNEREQQAEEKRRNRLQPKGNSQKQDPK
ncbi:39S ribosomal protein L52, mitochondrial isoform X2 [Lacerta agilis]|uniref:39S ribosomal protein L52, mitochondrial isoform X2 n=1 Tax=Lacerta agilis TaxID=80427 RepID=UPI001419AE9E|nr:39S ribosomal protein L52, mitochondrial isoform X2 [Lacerta agilis]